MLPSGAAFSVTMPHSVGGWRARTKAPQPAGFGGLSPFDSLPAGQRPPLEVVNDEPRLLGHVFLPKTVVFQKNPLNRMLKIVFVY